MPGEVGGIGAEGGLGVEAEGAAVEDGFVDVRGRATGSGLTHTLPGPKLPPISRL